LATIGEVGELEPYPDAIEASATSTTSTAGGRRKVDYLAALDKDGQPTAYLFRCRHCGQHLAYSDFAKSSVSLTHVRSQSLLRHVRQRRLGISRLPHQA
jgi:hypothetical protein